jgi:hypothetical protein
MRVLHLILHSDNPVYNAMEQITQAWYAQIPNVTTYYYRYDATVTSPELVGRCLRLPGTESYIPGILNKTVEALRYFCSDQETKFDVVIRSNISSLINFPRFLPRVAARLRTMLYGGTCIISADSIHPSHGHVDAKYMPVKFVHGTCLVLRVDAVKLLLQNENCLNRVTIDDVSLGVFFKRVSLEHESMNVANVIPFTTCEPQELGGEVLKFDAMTNIDEVLVFRNHTYHTDRLVDVRNLETQVRALQARYVDFPVGRPLKDVRYHTMSIMDIIAVLCKHANADWKTSCNNHALDALFGDPARDQHKQLVLEFEDGTLFAQAANLCFSFQSNKLAVV